MSFTRPGMVTSDSTDTLPPVQSWRIHLGAHKTATTHLQRTLSAIRPQLATHGVDFIPNQTVRDHGLTRELFRRNLAARVPFLRRSIMPGVLDGVLSPLRHGPQSVVISEENLIGTSGDAFSGLLYPLADTSIARLATLSERADMTFFLSIRSFDTFLPSAYAEALKQSPPPEGGFATVKRRILAKPPSWFGLVQRIRAIAPGIRLRIWRQEDYRSHKTEILSALCGCRLDALPEIPDPRRTASPSLEAIRKAEALPRELPKPQRRSAVLKAYGEAPSEPGRKFRPFSADESKALQKSYQEDLNRIAGLGADVLMKF